MISYFYISQDLSALDPGTAGLLLAFVRFILSAEGQAMAVEQLFDPLPTSLIAYNTATLDGLTLPANTPTYTVELASTTQIEVGAGAYVISGKRRSYAEYERTQFNESISTLQTTVSGISTDATADQSRDESTRAIALAGLALGIVGFIFGVTAFVIVLVKLSAVTPKPVQREVSFPKGGPGGPGAVSSTAADGVQISSLKNTPV